MQEINRIGMQEINQTDGGLGRCRNNGVGYGESFAVRHNGNKGNGCGTDGGGGYQVHGNGQGFCYEWVSHTTHTGNGGGD